MIRNRKRWATERDASDAQWLLAAATVALVLVFVAVLHCLRSETGAEQKERPMRVFVSLRPMPGAALEE